VLFPALFAVAPHSRGARHRFGVLSLLALVFAAWLWLQGPHGAARRPGSALSRDQLAWLSRLTLSTERYEADQLEPTLGEWESHACLLLIWPA
jgi:hypothetical protein